jgi:hypothetical protein
MRQVFSVFSPLGVLGSAGCFLLPNCPEYDLPYSPEVVAAGMAEQRAITQVDTNTQSALLT